MSFDSFVVRWELFWDCVKQPNFYNKIFEGLGNTLLIAFIGFIIGFLLGSILAITKILPEENKTVKVFSKICDIYVAIFRGTPMTVQLLVAYYLLLPLMGITSDSLTVAIIVFGLNSAAYVCEIMRSGILSVDKGQMEAGRSLGLNYFTTLTKIVLPQAIKNILPTLGNEFITLIKETSVVSFIGASDLFTAFQYIGSKNYEYMVPYLFMAVIYIIMIVILTIIIKIIEGRLRESDKR
jgi:polar amino acid transport system permease protein